MIAVPKLLVDTNVWLDGLLPRRPGHEAARKFFDFAGQREVPLLYAATTAKDVFFLAGATLKQEAREQGQKLTEDLCKAAEHIAWSCIEEIAEMGFSVGCDESDLWLARKYRNVHGDFEDDLIIAAAQRAGADFVVTGDKRLILHCPVAALDPADMLDHLQKTL